MSYTGARNYAHQAETEAKNRNEGAAIAALAQAIAALSRAIEEDMRKVRHDLSYIQSRIR
ncbi:hypothetical protein K6W16_10440 [Burkholderia dolosa]|uniref:Uncharacterized protein n=1 Tax=Burkholderia dolosa TaxID=152500 RepID=A0A892I8G6_9BURK|nr:MULTISPECIES: hypothetical protein [Burkholderia]AJY14090.1 hypothetical protein AK34_715 [Burkholderia dolosa AU0158]MBR8419814.1 hypothetical protein [Burkholderia dolosa]MBY4657929.1 hypothetical protein [Burkholderia dolosa]MBY4690051.1 hypothetical protein [Burkholderia dolosa]MBY4782789.1 hypothetical protein [Burkholderia dolosa]